MNATKIMMPLTTKVQKSNQRNKDHEAWALACKSPCMKYMIMLGSMDTKNS